jgi:tetratricopeptide (TPR) repeat protein
VKAVLETEGAAQAATVAEGHPELSTLPQAAPLLAAVDAELGHQTAALERLRVAIKSAPSDAAILGAYANTEKRLGRIDDAKEAARRYLAAYPSQVDAQLCYLEMYGSRVGDDQTRWTAECMTFLRQHRHEADAMQRFGSLAASEGWADIAFLLYENSLQENLTGMPFAIYYAASLVKEGNVAAADSVWHQLALRNDAQLSSASYVEAMVAWGSGRESEAMQIIERLRSETSDDPSRRRSLESLFRTFGYPKIADALAANRA